MIFTNESFDNRPIVERYFLILILDNLNNYDLHIYLIRSLNICKNTKLFLFYSDTLSCEDFKQKFIKIIH